MHIAVLLTNTDAGPFSRAHPRDDRRFAALLHLARPSWRIGAIDCVRDRLPPAPQGHDGYIVAGSPASANDPDDWIAALKAFIRACQSGGVPMFGACFGHQVIAAALGGTVRQVGWRLGLHEGPGALAWGDAAGPIRLFASHRDQVTDLPPGARLLAGTADCPVGAYAGPGRIYASQYHPEMPPAYFAALIAELAPQVGPGLAARARASLARGAPDDLRFARGLAAFFESAGATDPHATLP